MVYLNNYQVLYHKESKKTNAIKIIYNKEKNSKRIQLKLIIFYWLSCFYFKYLESL